MGALKLAKTKKITSQTKHFIFDIYHHFIREQISINGIKLGYCPTEPVHADIPSFAHIFFRYRGSIEMV